MKNWKRVVIGAAAAALLVTGAAAATVTGVSQRLLDYLGVGPEDSQTAELLIPGAMAVDITKEDNGAVFHVSQVLRDRTSILVLADFTAPEGTSLWMGERNGAVRLKRRLLWRRRPLFYGRSRGENRPGRLWRL